MPTRTYQSRSTRQSQALRMALAITAIGLLAMPGCYRRVISGRGIGADSEELRRQQEREPALRGVLTRTTEREKKPGSGVW